MPIESLAMQLGIMLNRIALGSCIRCLLKSFTYVNKQEACHTGVKEDYKLLL